MAWKPSRKEIAKLSREIQTIDRGRRYKRRTLGPLVEVDESALVEAEAKLVEILDQKSKRPYRHGWPDFLVFDPDTDSTIGIEVKRGDDDVSAAQATMFFALERAGIRVFVWNPSQPNKLTPWRSYRSGPLPSWSQFDSFEEAVKGRTP